MCQFVTFRSEWVDIRLKETDMFDIIFIEIKTRNGSFSSI